MARLNLGDYPQEARDAVVRAAVRWIDIPQCFGEDMILVAAVKAMLAKRRQRPRRRKASAEQSTLRSKR